MIGWVTRNWRWTVPSAVALAALGLWLFFGFFAFHTIWIDDTVDEPLPFFVAGPAPSGIDGDETTVEDAAAMNDAMAELNMPMLDEVDEPMPAEMVGAVMPSTSQDSSGDAGSQASQSQDPSSDGAAGTGEPDPTETQDSGESDAADGADQGDGPDGDAADSGDGQSGDDSQAGGDEQPEEPAQPEQPEEPEQPRIIVEASGSFMSRSHPTEGSALVLGDGSGVRFLRFEDFRTDNGPDLNVYLSAAAPDAPAGAFDDDFVDLGDLKGNVGAQNFEIPADVDLGHYSTVAVWCVRFSVVFGVAELNAG